MFSKRSHQHQSILVFYGFLVITYIKLLLVGFLITQNHHPPKSSEWSQGRDLEGKSRFSSAASPPNSLSPAHPPESTCTTEEDRPAAAALTTTTTTTGPSDPCQAESIVVMGVNLLAGLRVR